MTTAISPGIGVVIDDGIEPSESKADDIIRIIEKLEGRGIPTCQMNSISAARRFLPNLVTSTFILIDWNLFEPDEKLPPEVEAGAELREGVYGRVIDFIKELKKVCFAPIFLFTKENDRYIAEEIIPRLKKEGLYHEEGRNFIHVKTKGELLEDDKLLKDIESWIANSPSIHVLMSWQKEMLKAKNAVFWDLYDRSRGWPIILWRSYKKEGEQNPAYSISDMLFRLISSVALPPELDVSKLNLSSHFEPQEMMKLIRRTMVLEGNLSGVKPGDIFKVGEVYYLNIRPECDTVLREHTDENSEAGKDTNGDWDGKLYLVKGQKELGAQLKSDRKYSKKYGFIEHVKDAFVHLVTDRIDEVLVFDLSRLEVMNYEEIKGDRICRLLPPYVTKIQQRFASCVGRIGVHRMPTEIENEIIKNADSESS